MRRAKPEYQKKIATERIELLFKEAVNADAETAKKYMKLAKKIGMRYNVRIPGKFKRMYCKYCFAFLPNSKRRLKGGGLNIKCFSCNRTMRYLYKRKDALMK